MEKPENTFLRKGQKEAVEKMFSGCILNGEGGTGKSRTGLYFWFTQCGGKIETGMYEPMTNPKPLYIITTAKKRDSLEWEGELANYLLSTDSKKNGLNQCVEIVVDSWNKIGAYRKVKDAFFIFDEDRVTGKGKWVDSFLDITKNNEWIILSATPGDKWEDYMAVFLANRFYRTKSEFRKHFIYSRYTKYPSIIGLMNTPEYNEQRLIRLRDKILIDIPIEKHTVPHHMDIWCEYDRMKYKRVLKERWDIYKNQPIEQASELCHVLRHVVNEDDSRIVALLEILEKHPRAIIFYNFDYERDMLLHLFYDYEDSKYFSPTESSLGFEVAEYNGHAHEEIPHGKKWVYLVQYTAGCEGWNCLSTDTIIFYSQSYSFKQTQQACWRTDRLTSPFIDLYYYHLKSKAGIDLAISKALSQKEEFNAGKWVRKRNY